MISYLQKFNELPQELRDKISAPAVMAAISDIEMKYSVNLAIVVMRVMVKDIVLDDLVNYFVFSDNVEKSKAEKLVQEMRSRVFGEVSDYLEIEKIEGGQNEKVEMQAQLPFESMDEKEKLDSWIGKKKSDISDRSSDFFFSPEDEEEVKEQAKKVKSFKKEEGVDDQVDEGVKYEKIIDEIVEKVHISFSSTDLISRFRQILKTYIKGVRKKIDTKQAFIKSIESGGLGLSDDFADSIIRVADEVKKNFKYKKEESGKPRNLRLPEGVERGKFVENEDEGIERDLDILGSRDVEYDFGKFSKQNNVKKEDKFVNKNAVELRRGEEVEVGDGKVVKKESSDSGVEKRVGEDAQGVKADMKAQAQVSEILEKSDLVVGTEDKEDEIKTVNKEEVLRENDGGISAVAQGDSSQVQMEGGRIQEDVDFETRKTGIEQQTSVQGGEAGVMGKMMMEGGVPVVRVVGPIPGMGGDVGSQEKQKEKKKTELKKKRVVQPMPVEEAKSKKKGNVQMLNPNMDDNFGKIGPRVDFEGVGVKRTEDVGAWSGIKEGGLKGFFFGNKKQDKYEGYGEVAKGVNVSTARGVKKQDGKIQMQDVKYVPRLMGPIDELREMNLLNFRRLSNNPAASAKKIVEKISFLEEDSYAQRLAGIKAWRQSPLNKLYIELGSDSIRNKKSINAIIEDMKNAGRETLSIQEFAAIMDLNKDLRF